MAVGVLDSALTALDWAMTASDVYDTAAVFVAGPVGIVGKGGKVGIKLALKRARKAVTKAVDNAVKAAKEASSRLSSAVKSGRGRRNAHLAGKKHPETGVPFNGEARADFSGVSVKEVEIEFSKPINRRKDRAAANKAAGFDKTPDGYVWHHADNGKMQLVPQNVHAKTGHDGPLSPH